MFLRKCGIHGEETVEEFNHHDRYAVAIVVDEETV